VGAAPAAPPRPGRSGRRSSPASSAAPFSPMPPAPIRLNAPIAAIAIPSASPRPRSSSSVSKLPSPIVWAKPDRGNPDGQVRLVRRRVHLRSNHHAGPAVLRPFDRPGHGYSPQIKPAALLPFLVTSARPGTMSAAGSRGSGSRPRGSRPMHGRRGRLAGVYLPYWTFDSQTRTRYLGRRGDYYTVPMQVRTRVNGRMVTQTRQVRRSAGGRPAARSDGSSTMCWSWPAARSPPG
jgi:hypothetical protein